MLSKKEQDYEQAKADIGGPKKVACSSRCGESACDCREEHFKQLQANLALIPPQSLKVIHATDSSEHAYIVCGNQYIVQNIRIEHALRIVRCWNSHDDFEQATKDFIKGWGHFCDCIDFGKSNLDAEAIQFMNEVPGKIQQAFTKATS